LVKEDSMVTEDRLDPKELADIERPAQVREVRMLNREVEAAAGRGLPVYVGARTPGRKPGA
jgi:hypothetical protein